MLCHNEEENAGLQAIVKDLSFQVEKLQEDVKLHQGKYEQERESKFNTLQKLNEAKSALHQL